MNLLAVTATMNGDMVIIGKRRFKVTFAGERFMGLASLWGLLRCFAFA